MVHNQQTLEQRLEFTQGLLDQHEPELSEQGIMLVKRAIFSCHLALRRWANNAA